MTLTEYIKCFPRHERSTARKQIAKEIGVSEVFIRSMCNGTKKIPGIHAIAIERATQGKVSRHVTSPMLYPREEKIS